MWGRCAQGPPPPVPVPVPVLVLPRVPLPPQMPPPPLRGRLGGYELRDLGLLGLPGRWLHGPEVPSPLLQQVLVSPLRLLLLPLPLPPPSLQQRIRSSRRLARRSRWT